MFDLRDYNHCPLSGLPIICKPEWSLTSENDEYEEFYALISDNIIYNQMRGNLNLELMTQSLIVGNKIRNEWLSKDNKYFKIYEISGLDKISRDARNHYFNNTQLADERVLMEIFSGTSFLAKSIIVMGCNLTKHSEKVIMVKNYEQAIQKTQNHSLPKADLTETEKPKSETEKHIEELVNYLATISWDHETSQELPILVKENPFKNLYESVRLLKSDLLEMNSARSRTAILLETSEQEHRGLLDESTDIIYKKNMKGGLDYLSKAFEDITGFSMHDSEEDKISALESMNQNSVAAFKHELKTNGYVKNNLSKRRHKNGSEWWGAESTHLLKDDLGNVVGVAGIIRDISTFKILEDKLIESQKKLNLAVESAHLAIWEANLKTLHNVSNSIWAELIGMSPEEYKKFNGTPQMSIFWENCIHPEDLKGILTKVENFVKKNDKGILMLNYRVLLKTSEVRWIEGRSKIVEWDENQAPLRITGVMMDSTKRNQQEEMMKQSMIKAEEANLSKSNFIANMSHEIRTPLNLIGGYSQILAQNLDNKELSGESREQLNNIHLASQHLSELVNNILDLSKIEAGKLEVNLEDLALKSLIQSVVQIHREAAKKKGIQLNYFLGTGLPILIHCDRLKLNQMLNNLIGNALKFTPENGNIDVRTKKHIDSEKNHWLLIEVEDTGTGIPQDQLKKVFEKFEQVDNSTTREFGGTGLGLALCNEFVELLEGKISVESRVGIGSTFTVTIPLRKAQSALNDAALDEKSLTENYAGKTILLVEDDIETHKMMSLFLNNLGIELQKAYTGIEGIEQARLHLPDLILMDMHMPLMDGIEAIKNIREIPECSKIPVILISADAFKEQREGFEASGIDAFLSKPVDFQKLQKVLEQYLRTESMISRTAKTRKLEKLPSETLEQIKSYFEELMETPTYLNSSIDSILKQIRKLNSGGQSILTPVLQEINEAQAVGDYEQATILFEKGHAILKEMLHN